MYRKFNLQLHFLLLPISGLPEMLLRQYEYEDPIVRGGKHLLHSAFFKELVALACHLGLDSLPCCSETYKWAWFRYYIITELIFFIGKRILFHDKFF